MSFIFNGCFYGKEKIVTDLRVLKALEKRNTNLRFHRKYKFVVYAGYVEHGEKLISYSDHIYRLKYFDGCFSPYCVDCGVTK